MKDAETIKKMRTAFLEKQNVSLTSEANALIARCNPEMETSLIENGSWQARFTAIGKNPDASPDVLVRAAEVLTKLGYFAEVKGEYNGTMYTLIVRL